MLRSLLSSVLAVAGLAVAGDLSGLERRADEVVHVHLNAATLHALSQAVPADADDARFFEALAGVREIRVTSLEFHDEDIADKEDLDAMRAGFVAPGWSRFLSSRSHDPDELVEGYLGPEGMAIIAAEAGELTVVRIDGVVTAAAAPLFGHRFGLPAIAAQTDTPATALSKRDKSPTSAATHAQKLDFKRIVHDVEASQGIHHMRIPLMGLVKPVAFVATKGSVRALDFALFDDAPRGFVDAVDRAVPEGWTRMVETRGGREATNIYVGDVDERMPLLIATWDGDGVLLTVKASLKDFCQSPAGWLSFGHKHDDDDR